MDQKEGQDKDIQKQVTRFYDQNCQDFSVTRGAWWSDLDFIRKYLKKKGRVLDFGCGNGRFLDFLEKEAPTWEYFGADVSRGLVAIAQQKYPKEKFFVLKEDGFLPLEKEKFDLVVAIAVFHHLSPDMLKKSLKEIRRVLKPEGKLILTVWHLWKVRYLRFLLKDIFLKKLFWGGEIPFGNDKKQTRWCYWWTLRQLRKVLHKSGFVVLENGISQSKRGQKRNYWLVGGKDMN